MTYQEVAFYGNNGVANLQYAPHYLKPTLAMADFVCENNGHLISKPLDRSW